MGANKTEAEIGEGTGNDTKRQAPLFLLRTPLGRMVLDIPFFTFNSFFCRKNEDRLPQRGAPVSFACVFQLRSIQLLFSFHSYPWNEFYPFIPIFFLPLLVSQWEKSYLFHHIDHDHNVCLVGTKYLIRQRPHSSKVQFQLKQRCHTPFSALWQCN